MLPLLRKIDGIGAVIDQTETGAHISSVRSRLSPCHAWCAIESNICYKKIQRHKY